MEPRPRQVLLYTDARGRQPLSEWIEALKDSRMRAVIKVRIARLEAGNFGDCRSVGQGVRELRIHDGPGFRVYFAEAGGAVVLLLSGGSKGNQAQDIQRAKEYWQDAQETL
jgi:putative addiction module killer protein